MHSCVQGTQGCFPGTVTWKQRRKDRETMAGATAGGRHRARRHDSSVAKMETTRHYVFRVSEISLGTFPRDFTYVFITYTFSFSFLTSSSAVSSSFSCPCLLIPCLRHFLVGLLVKCSAPGVPPADPPPDTPSVSRCHEETGRAS